MHKRKITKVAAKAIRLCGMKGDIYPMTYHCVNRGSKEESINSLESSSNIKQTHHTVIVSFTKFDVIGESKTRDKLNRVKLHNNAKHFLPSKTCVILGEGIQYVFPENL